jgi:hypothetical protein
MRPEVEMPRISAFYGIAIYMYYRDHAPPHFHAIYGEREAAVHIANGDVIAGDLPRRALDLVRQWNTLHRTELDDNWNRATAGQPLLPIDPLD